MSSKIHDDMKVDPANQQEKFVLGTWDIVAVVGYFVVILGVGMLSMLRNNRNTVSGFFLAGKSMFWLPVGFSLFASNIGSEHFIGLSGSGAAAGIGVGAFEFNAMILLQVLGFIFLPVYIASKVCTLPEYMMKRFGGQRIRTYLAVLSMILYIFTKISVNLYSGALFIQQALQWNLYLSIFALLALTCVCTIGGGLAAVIYIDVVQVIIMVAGSSVLLFRGLEEVGGWSALQKSYLQAIPDQIEINPYTNMTCGVPKSDSWVILREPVGSDMPWPGFIFGQTPASIWYWCADQIMVQKALSARSLTDAQGATILAGWIKVLPMFLIVVPGMISRVLFPNEVGCVNPEKCMEICQNPASCSNIAYPRLVLGIMPEGLRGIMISVMLAALMSDLTSIFNSSSTLFTMDIYRRIRTKAGNKELLLVGRLCILGLVAISIAWIPLIQQMQGGQLYIYIQSIAAYLSPPIAMIFCMAIIWPRMNEKGAFWALMTGLVIGVIRMGMDFAYPAPLCMNEDLRPAIVSQFHYMYFATFLFWITGIVAVIISLATSPGNEYMTVRTTWSKLKMEDIRPDEGKEVQNIHQNDNAKAEHEQGTELRLLDPNSLNHPDEDVERTTVLNNANRAASPQFNIKNYLESCICPEEDENTIEDEIRYDGGKSSTDQVIESLTQTTRDKVLLYINLVIIVTGALGFYVYFSINPFSDEEILNLQDIVLRNISQVSSEKLDAVIPSIT